MASSSESSFTLHFSPLLEEQSSIFNDHVPDSTPANEKYFLVHLRHPGITSEFHSEYERKLKALKNVLSKERKNALEGLTMIDAIQRLGIEYQFQEEIHAILMENYVNPSACYSDSDLEEVALRFRLLRQEGYCVSADIFKYFKDEEGKFKERLSDDIKGLMSLYDASELSIQGEDILDEARNYSYQLLSSSMKHADDPEARAIENTLKHPHHKSLPNFIPKEAITNIQWQNGWINEFQQLAMFDHKMVRFLHQQEICQISKWWKEMGLSRELKFARDQPVKWYVWCMTALTDPSLSQQRIDLIKPISFVYLIDDIFDVYGTLDELIVFTQFVDRWDIAAIDQLPDYMRICFKALNDIINEISCKVYEQHGWNPVDSLRKSWASLFNAFLVEARWFASGNLPSSEEYLKNGIVSSGVHVVLVHLFFLLGQGITKKNVEFLDRNPGIISSTATILRLWDDLGSAKDEKQDGYDGSYVDCYMKERQESSAERARKHVFQMITDTWKRLNQNCLHQNPFSPTFTKACLNVARMVPLMYSYDENSCLPYLEEHVKSLLSENISM